ncbi:MAG TPA: thioredoxin-like domain-containing protein [Candidatus Polarisedimenticolia bacterium]|jgi:thiol-disulfide isomerase/thioredoxin
MDPRTVRSPEFPPDSIWLNTRRPLTVSGDLRGRVALLDFWTYCCINCMHVLPVLLRLEARFAAEPFIVVGVHSAKFISEKDPLNIRRAIQRYGVAHPVVVDPDHDIWERFAVKAWPTLALLDAGGYVRAMLPGEADEEDLVERIETLLQEGRARGILAAGPLDIAPDPDAGTTFLRFPGKLHVAGDRLFIADSGHDRIVMTDLDGGVRAIIGEGGAGAHDGPAPLASFHNPQGMAVMDGTLYVADTGNHLVRAVDLETMEVSTVAGTAELGRGRRAGDPSDPLSVPLRSPWALLPLGSHLLIAMAGSHQLWVYDPDRNVLAPWAGSGREDHIDGPLDEAAFAQPSGLTAAGKYVIVADSEVSSVRAVDLEDGQVRTLVGRGLFDFGDSIGTPDRVMLQHPLDVAAGPGCVYIADTYNNKVKAISFGSMETTTVFGDGTPETMHEPGGLAVAGGRVLIADTNNHRLLRGDPATGALEELSPLAG